MLYAFMLTLFAGLSTGIGAMIAFVTKRTNVKFLSFALGFSAGVMIYISLNKMLPEGQSVLLVDYPVFGKWIAVGAFFGSILFTGIIDYLIPDAEDLNEEQKTLQGKQLLRVGLMTAIAVTLHNFPEGMATFMAGLSKSEMAWPIAVAIAIHNIPEGIAVSVPIFFATGNRFKAFFYSFLSGLVEPIGALVGYFVFLRPFFQEESNLMFGIVFSCISGIMVYISFDELLPTANKYDDKYQSIVGLFAGMLVMAVSLAV